MLHREGGPCNRAVTLSFPRDEIAEGQAALLNSKLTLGRNCWNEIRNVYHPLCHIPVNAASGYVEGASGGPDNSGSCCAGGHVDTWDRLEHLRQHFSDVLMALDEIKPGEIVLIGNKN